MSLFRSGAWSWQVASPAAAGAAAVLLYLLVVLVFRLGKRRTVAELAPFDLAAVIAVGAITGRTATGGTSLVTGVAAVAGLMLGHALVSRARRRPWVRSLVDHPTSVLVVDGRVRHDELHRAGLTESDLQAALRSRGVRSLDDVRVAVFETRAGVSVLTVGTQDDGLWREVLEDPRRVRPR